jgi:hypothetical protein
LGIALQPLDRRPIGKGDYGASFDERLLRPEQDTDPGAADWPGD